MCSAYSIVGGDAFNNGVVEVNLARWFSSCLHLGMWNFPLVLAGTGACHVVFHAVKSINLFV